MKKIYLGLGSNMGDREQMLRQALAMIGNEIGTITACSSLYRTKAVGFEGDDFLNMVASVASAVSPSGLIGRLLMIESKLGRIRCEGRYSSRTIDIDVLFIDDQVINSESLIVPHPRLHERRFVLEPLNEIAPELVHPLLGKTAGALLKDCTDESPVVKLPYPLNTLNS